MSTTTSVNTSSSDGYLEEVDGTYSTARNAAVADSVNKTGSLWVGQRYAYPNYYINRAFLYFDTSILPDDAVIISAKLVFYLNADGSTDDFNIVIRRNTAGTYPSDPLVTSDFDYTFYTGDGGSLNTAYLTSGWNEIILNSTGISWINLTGVTKLVLISSKDINAVAPTGNEYFYLLGQETLAAKLTITYSAEKYPSATTQATTNIKDVTVKGNGTLTDGGLATEWGFEYGLTETPTWKVSKVITIAESAFSLNINGLEPETTYYYRAFVTNSFGTAYGGWVSFTTTAGPSYDVYTEPNTAKYRLYVSDDEAIAWRGYKGPYSGKQTLINISDITNKTKGVKVLKVDLPDANTKGNFHICITVKQTLKG